jgi:hypothetical protein
MSSAEALIGNNPAMQLHGQLATPGCPMLQLASQVAVSLQELLPLGTPPTPPQASAEYCLKLHNDMALQSVTSAILMQGKNTFEAWQPAEQPVPNSTPQPISVAQALSQSCLSLMPFIVAISDVGVTPAMSELVIIICIGAELAQATTRRSARMAAILLQVPTTGR